MKKIILSLLILLFVYCSQGYSQFVWQNPYPTNNGLKKTFWINGNTGYAAGEAGTLLKTTNGGDNWSITNITTKSVISMYFINDQTGWVNTLTYWVPNDSCVIYKTTNGGTNWIKQYSHQTQNYSLYSSIYFINAMTGFASSQFINVNLLKTTNGGNNWSEVYFAQNKFFSDIFFTDSLYGYISGLGDFYKTTNGGNNWIQSGGVNFTSQFECFYISRQTGWSCGAGGSVSKTVDGGSSWTRYPVNNGNKDLYTVRFLNEQTGWTAGDKGKISMTTNGGITWALQPITDSTNFKSMYIASPQKICAVGDSGQIFITTNLGTTWNKKSSGYYKTLNSVNFVNSMTGYTAGKSGTVLKTTNAGINWISNNVNTSNGFSVVKFLNSSTGYAVGENGAAFKTINGGQTWDSMAVGTTSTIVSLFFLNQLTGWIGAYGVVIKTTNGGTNWISYGVGMNTNNLFINFINASTGWYTDSYRIYKSVNGGVNWTQISNINQLYDLKFMNDQTGWATSSGKLYKSTNSGYNWTNVQTNDSDNYFLHFITPQKFYVSGRYGLKNTNDEGSSWTSYKNYFLTSGNYINSIYFTDSLTGYFTGKSGTILKTTNGGSVFVNTIGTNIPSSIFLGQNYPNPFNPSTVVRFQLSVVSDVSLKVYDVQGREVQTLVKERMNAGTYEVKFDGSSLNSGVYFYRLTTDNFTETKKMLLIK